MMKSKLLIYGILALSVVGIIFISGCVQQRQQSVATTEQSISGELEPQQIPTIMVYQRTKYTNCHVNPNYPFQTDKELTTISGVVEEKTGTRMFPWNAAVVDNKSLFNPETSNLVYNFDKMKGKIVTIKGYSGTGQISMNVAFKPGETTTITFDNTFYVSEIIGWQSICCNSISGDTGAVSSGTTCYWFKKETIKSCTPASDYPYQTDKEITTLSGITKKGKAISSYPSHTTAGMRNSVVIDDKHLFNIKRRKQISEFDFWFNPIGKNLTVKGYPEETATVVYPPPFKVTEVTVKFDNIFYVSEIVGWQSISCTDIQDNKTIYYWFRAT